MTNYFTCFWHNGVFLMSWFTAWCHDVFRMSWLTFLCNDELVDFMTCFWRLDKLFDVMTYFLHPGLNIYTSYIYMYMYIYIYILRCPTFDLIIFFNSHPCSNIPTEVFYNLWQYLHLGLNIYTSVEIFEPGEKYLNRGGNSWTGVEIFPSRLKYLVNYKKNIIKFVFNSHPGSNIWNGVGIWKTN